jgi:ATP-dependent Lon protease
VPESPRSCCRKRNEADIEDIPEDVRSQLKFHCLGTLDEVFEIALVPTNSSGNDAADVDGRG